MMFICGQRGFLFSSTILHRAITVITLRLMTADDAGATALRHLQIDRDIPFTEIRRTRTDEAFLVGAMDAVTDPAGATLITLVDMQFVEIAITVAEVGLRGAREFGKPLGVAAKAEGIDLRVISGIETLRKGRIQQRFKCGTMRIVAGHTFAILDRLVLRLGRRHLRLNAVMTTETKRALFVNQELRLAAAMRIVTDRAAAIGDRTVLRHGRRRQSGNILVTAGA